MHVLPDGFHRIRHYGFFAKGERGFNLSYQRLCWLTHWGIPESRGC